MSRRERERIDRDSRNIPQYDHKHQSNFNDGRSKDNLTNSASKYHSNFNQNRMSSTRPIKNNNHYHADYQPYSDKRYNTPKNDDTRYKDVKQRRYDDSKKYDDNRFDHEPLQKRRFDDESTFSQQKRISIEPRRFEDRRVIEKDRQLDVLDRQISNPPQVYATNKRHTQSNSKELPMTKVGVTVSRFPVYKNTNMYEMGSQVGEGTYGQVFKAKSRLTGKLVALKRLYLHEDDKGKEKNRDGFPITAIREIEILRSLSHPHIIELEAMIATSTGNAFFEMYMVFEYMDHDLTGILNNSAAVYGPSHIKCLASQLFLGLDYLHQKKIIHRDVKGANLLLNNQGYLKIADFGLARRFHLDRDSGDPLEGFEYTNRVVTLWYRSPELLLGSTSYGTEVDIWSTGCILLEFFTKYPIFQGRAEIDQLELIFKLCGSPSVENWPGIKDLPWYGMMQFTPTERLLVNEFSQPSYGLSTEFVFLLDGLLTLDPSKRPTAKQALSHPWFLEEEPFACHPSELPRIEGDWHEYEGKLRKKGKAPVPPPVSVSHQVDISQTSALERNDSRSAISGSVADEGSPERRNTVGESRYPNLLKVEDHFQDGSIPKSATKIHPDRLAQSLHSSRQIKDSKHNHSSDIDTDYKKSERDSYHSRAHYRDDGRSYRSRYVPPSRNDSRNDNYDSHYKRGRGYSRNRSRSSSSVSRSRSRSRKYSRRDRSPSSSVSPYRYRSRSPHSRRYKSRGKDSRSRSRSSTSSSSRSISPYSKTSKERSSSIEPKVVKAEESTPQDDGPQALWKKFHSSLTSKGKLAPA